MMSNNDLDLKRWAADWQAASHHATSAEQIRLYVRQRTGLLWSFAVADFVVGGLALPVVLYLAVMAETEVERLAMLGLGSITVAAVIFGWWNRRGLLRSRATTIADYVVISVERLRRMRLAWRIGWLVLASQLVLFSILITNRFHSQAGAPLSDQRFAWSWLAGMTIAAVIGLVYWGRWLRHDEQRFEALRREIGEP